MMECLCLNCCLLCWPLPWFIALVTARAQTVLSVSFQASLWAGGGGRTYNRVCTQACKVTWHLQSESQGSTLRALYWCSYVQGCKSFAHQIDLCCWMWEPLIFCFIVLVFILSVLDIDYQNRKCCWSFSLLLMTNEGDTLTAWSKQEAAVTWVTVGWHCLFSGLQVEFFFLLLPYS